MKKSPPVIIASPILKRGLVHIFAGLFTAASSLFLSEIVFLLSLGIITFVFLSLDLLRRKISPLNDWAFTVFRPLLRDREKTRLTGASYVLIGSLLTFIIFSREIAILAVCFMAVGDATATMIGTHFGKRKLLTGKTLEGSLACFTACLAIGFFFSVSDLPVHWIIVLTGAITATVVEVLPLPVNDNLSMPLLAGLAMTVLPFA